jgi:hypothetical protein
VRVLANLVETEHAQQGRKGSVFGI